MQSSISESLRYLPVYLTACNMVIIFMGPSCAPLPATDASGPAMSDGSAVSADLSRLWCVWELFIIHSTRTLEELICWSIAPFTLSDDLPNASASFDLDKCGCFIPEDKASILGIIDAFSKGGAKAFEQRVGRALTALATGVAPKSKVQRQRTWRGSIYAEAKITRGDPKPSVSDVEMASATADLAPPEPPSSV